MGAQYVSSIHDVNFFLLIWEGGRKPVMGGRGKVVDGKGGGRGWERKGEVWGREGGREGRAEGSGWYRNTRSAVCSKKSAVGFDRITAGSPNICF